MGLLDYPYVEHSLPGLLWSVPDYIFFVSEQPIGAAVYHHPRVVSMWCCMRLMRGENTSEISPCNEVTSVNWDIERWSP